MIDPTNEQQFTNNFYYQQSTLKGKSVFFTVTTTSNPQTVLIAPTGCTLREVIAIGTGSMSINQVREMPGYPSVNIVPSFTMASPASVLPIIKTNTIKRLDRLIVSANIGTIINFSVNYK
jgi:hypothetical protein